MKNPCRTCRLFRKGRCAVNPIPRKGTTPGCDLHRDVGRLV